MTAAARVRRRQQAIGVVVCAAVAACAGRPSPPAPIDLASAAERYVRIVLALGERDADSLDGYHGPPEWQREARERRATLADIRRDAAALADAASADLPDPPRTDDEIRRAFLARQLRAVVARVDVLQGARLPFAAEAQRLFGLIGTLPPEPTQPVVAALERLVPGHGPLPERLAAFEQTVLIPADRLPPVMARAIEGCRASTRAHVTLPPDEGVEAVYVADSAWSALTRYEGRGRSTIRINASLPLTIDRALDLACHEAYPGHHLIATLVDARLGTRAELQVQATFSPQSLLHEAASSNAGALAFSDAERLAFERDVLFPLAGLDPAAADRHVRIGRLLDRLHGLEGTIARRYLDGELDVARAAVAFERDALMASADATLKFLNQFRSYAATYTIGRDLFWRRLDEKTNQDNDGLESRWRAYVDFVTSATQVLPPAEPRR